MTLAKDVFHSLPSAKSPYSLAVPSERMVKVLLINPNCTHSMTLNCLKMVEQNLPPDTVVYGYTAGQPSPTTIEGHLDGVLSSAYVIRDAYNMIQAADACLVACFSDHPLTNCIREEFDIPTCGIMEAALYSARIIGGRFGILATVYRSQIRHYDAVRSYGLEGHCAGLLSTGLKVSELELKPRNEVLSIMSQTAVTLVEEKDADVIVLGCAGMSDMKEAVEKAVKSRGVEVVDGVVAGVNLLSGVVRCGLKTSKRGLFCSSREGRVARGQNYL